LLDLSAVLRAQGRLTEAETLSREELERSRRVLGDDHLYTISPSAAWDLS
jgi:hypothetical protein